MFVSRPRIPVEALCEDRQAAQASLASHLREGTLALFLGAGVSKPIGLPSWRDLVIRCLQCAGRRDEAAIIEATSNPSSEMLREYVDSVEATFGSNFDRYAECVRAALYTSVDYTSQLIRERLLIAFGALLMGSSRGSVRDVVSFNFDDVLEWYLSLHGFTTNIVVEHPWLHRDRDVTIAHMHGFLPRENVREGSAFLIFSRRSYNKKGAADYDPWKSHFQTVLLNKVGLFVGLSGNDPTFGPMFENVRGKLRSERETGFWLIGPDVETKKNAQYLQELGFVTVHFDEFDEIPDFLLSVCQAAAGPV